MSLDVVIDTGKSLDQIDKLAQKLEEMNKALSDTDRIIIKTSNQIKASTVHFKKFKNEIEGISSKLGGVTKSLGTQGSRFETWAKKVDKATASANAFDKSNVSLGSAVAGTTMKMKNATKATTAASKANKVAVTNFRQLTSVVGASDIALQKMVGSGMALQAMVVAVVGAAFAKALLDVELATDRARRQISILTGDMASANAEFEYAKQVSKDLGLNFMAVTKEYAKFLAASKSSTLSTQELRGVFVSFSKALAANQSSVQDTELVFLALNQMMSKGKVSSEELRRQLAERLPGAFQTAAKSIGLTVAELDDALRQGTLATDEFIVAFSKTLEADIGLRAAESAAEGTQAAVNNLTNSWNELLMIANKSGGSSLAKFFLEVSESALDRIKETIQEIKDLIDSLPEQKVAKGLGDIGSVYKAQAKEAVREILRIEKEIVKLRKFQADPSISKTDKALFGFASNAADLGLKRLELIDRVSNYGVGSYAKILKQVQEEQKKATKTQTEINNAESEAARKRILANQKLVSDLKKFETIARQSIQGETLRQRLTLVENIVEKSKELQALSKEEQKALPAAQKNLLDPKIISQGEKAIEGIKNQIDDMHQKDANDIVRNMDLRENAYESLKKQIKELNLDSVTENKALVALDEKRSDYASNLVRKSLSSLDLLKIRLSNLKAEQSANENLKGIKEAILNTENEINKKALSTAEIYVNQLREQGMLWPAIREEAERALEAGELEVEAYNELNNVIGTKVKKELIALNRQYGQMSDTTENIVQRFRDSAREAGWSQEKIESLSDAIENKAVKGAEKLNSTYKEFNGLVNQSITSITDRLADAIMGLDKNFSDVIKNMLQQWYRFQLETNILTPLIGDPSKGATAGNGIIGDLFSGIFGGGTSSSTNAAVPDNNYLGLPTGYEVPSFGPDFLGMSADPRMVSKSATKVEVNNYNGSNVQAQTVTDSQGNETIRLMIRSEMNSAILDGSVDKSMGAVYGSKRVGVK